MQNNPISEIDLDRIVRERAGSYAKFIPQFLIDRLKKLIHQDFLNVYLRQGYVGVDFCEQALKYLDVTLQVKGLEHIQDDTLHYTVVSNHPLGGIDGLALGMIFGKRFDGKVKYLVNDLLMNLHGLAPLCIPINKMGRQARSFPQMVESAFHSDNHIIMFPAGLCSRMNDEGQIVDLPWKKTFVSKSVETERYIVPVHFIGKNSSRFYRVARWCKKLRLKFNFAMLLLPDEMYRNRHRTYQVVIGKPIPWTQFNKSRSAAQWAAWMRDEVYRLK